MASSAENTTVQGLRAIERRSLWRMAVPMIASELIAVLIPMAVLVLMGRMGEQALYVRSLFAPLAFLFIALQACFGIAAQVVAAISHGQKQPREVLARVASVGRLGLATAVVVIGLVISLAPALADLLAVGPEARAEFIGFVRWVAAANIAVLGPALCLSALRGAGKAWTASVVMLTTAALEVSLVYLLGLRGGQGIDAVPVAIVAANVAGTVLALALIRRTDLWQAKVLREWRPDVTRILLSVGLPVAASFIIIFASNLALTWVVSPFGPVVVSGFATAATLQSVVIVPAVALGSATAILMNQYLGAGRPERLMPSLRVCLETAVLIYAVLAPVCWLARRPIALWLTGDQTVARETAAYLAAVGPTYLFMGIVLVALTVMEQVRAGLLALLLNALYFAGMVAVAAVLTRHSQDPHTLYVTVAVANSGGIAVVPILVLLVRRIARSVSRPASPDPTAVV